MPETKRTVRVITPATGGWREFRYFENGSEVGGIGDAYAAFHEAEAVKWAGVGGTVEYWNQPAPKSPDWFKSSEFTVTDLEGSFFENQMKEGAL